MRKLTVWIGVQDKDHDCYNIVGRTRKELLDKIEKHDFSSDYEWIGQVRIEYIDIFDLFEICTGEGGRRDFYIGDLVSLYRIVDGVLVRRELDEWLNWWSDPGARS